MDQKKEFIILYKSRAYSISHLAQMFEISRPTAYKFIKRYEDHGMKGLLEISRKPSYRTTFKGFLMIGRVRDKDKLIVNVHRLIILIYRSGQLAKKKHIRFTLEYEIPNQITKRIYGLFYKIDFGCCISICFCSGDC